MRNVTIKDLAKITGYSVATVSRVINNNGRFSKETKEKILTAIEETGYQMNYSAKSLRMKKSFSVGIIVPDISNYFFNQLVQKIEVILFNKGYSTIICNTDRNIEKEKNYISMLESKGVDGIIIVSGNQSVKFDDLEIPYICIDREPINKKGTIYISSDHFDGGYKATKALIENGCKFPIIAMYDRRESSSAKLRFNGFKKALNEYNIKFDKDVSVLPINNKTDLSIEIKKLLSKNKKVDGIFTVNDFIAHEIIKVLKDLKIDIPKDMKIIGFDDNDFNIYITPQLSSVYQNIDLLSEITVNTMLEMFDKQIKLGQSITIPIELNLRESVIK